MRIVSLLPSATEIVCELGLRDRLVGVTHECDFPSCVRDLPKVTRTLIPQDASSCEIDALVRERLKKDKALYSLDMPTLEQLRPDLIVTQALCDVCAVAESEVNAAACHLPGQPKVINLEPTCLEEVFECMNLVGNAAGASIAALEAITRLKARIEAVKSRTACVSKRRRVVLLEWIDPPFSSGHWSPELARLAGGIEMIGQQEQRSRTITWEQVLEADPEIMVVACCGFDIDRTLTDIPLLAKNRNFQQLRCVRDEQIYVVDGNAYFSRPGPRLVDSLEILAAILHPEIHPLSLAVNHGKRLNMNELQNV